MKIVYLLLFPTGKTLEVHGKQIAENISRAPYFLDIDIEIKQAGENVFEVDGVKVDQKVFTYDNSVMLFECSYSLSKVLGDGLSKEKEHINSLIRSKLVGDYSPDKNLVEEYTVLLVDNTPKINEFVKENDFALARFMRSVEKKISQHETDEIMTTKISYSNEDLSIIDWEGAVVIDKEGDFDSQLELLKIGNYQLMRYRILDQIIENNLKDVREGLGGKKKKIFGNQFVRLAIENKLSILLDFDSVDQSLLLVGDWYSAKFYRAVMDEFYLEDWKNLVKNKIESLESIDAAVRDNLSFSWSRILDFLQIVGWMVLLIGYFVLYLKDANFF